MKYNLKMMKACTNFNQLITVIASFEKELREKRKLPVVYTIDKNSAFLDKYSIRIGNRVYIQVEEILGE